MEPGHMEVTEAQASHRPGDCRVVGTVLARVGDKWSILVVMTLTDGPRRFNELKRIIGGISQRMLTFTLRGLGARRPRFRARSPRQSRPGWIMNSPSSAARCRCRSRPLGSWAFANLPTIQAARTRFDAGGETDPA